MVFEKIREMICDLLDLEDDEVTLGTYLREDLDADSLDLYDLKCALEEEFGIAIEEEELEEIETVRDIVEHIKEHMA